MNMNHSTSTILRYGIVIGIILTAAGAMMSVFNIFHSADVIWIGLLAIIATPFTGLIVTTISLAVNREIKWLYTALILVTIMIIGMILAVTF